MFVEYLATMLPCVLMSLNCPYLILFVSVCRNSSVDTSKYRNTEMGKQAGLKFFSKFSIRNFSWVTQTCGGGRRAHCCQSLLFFQVFTVFILTWLFLFHHTVLASPASILAWPPSRSELSSRFILSGRFWTRSHGNILILELSNILLSPRSFWSKNS